MSTRDLEAQATCFTIFKRRKKTNTNQESSKDCWHYDVCVVLDGNPLVVEQESCVW